MAGQRPRAGAVRAERDDPRRVPAASRNERFGQAAGRRGDAGRGTERRRAAAPRYCTLVYAETGSYQETARRLDLDRRTVKDKVDPELLSRLESEPGVEKMPRRSRA